MGKQSEASLLLKIKEAGAEALAKVKDGFEEIGAKAAAASAVITGALGLSVKAYGEAEEANNKLDQSIKNQGLDVESLAKRYDDLASAIQDKTTVDGDELKAALASAQAMAGSIELTDDLIKATVDYAQATGTDLNSAFEKVGRSIGTSTNALAREGIELDTTASKTEKMDEITKALSQRFEGMAEVQALGLGSTQQLSNAVGDLAEAVGENLAPYVASAAKTLTTFVKAVSDNKDVVKYGTAVAAFAAGFSGLVAAIAGVMAAWPALVAAFAVLAGPAGIVIGATAAIAALATAWVTNFGSIQEVTGGVLEAMKAFIDAFAADVVRVFGGIGDVIGGAFSLDFDQIKRGIGAITAESQISLEDLKKSYRDGFEARKAELAQAIEHQGKEEEKAARKGVAVKTAAISEISNKERAELKKRTDEAVNEAKKKAAEELKEAEKARVEREIKETESLISMAEQQRLKKAEAKEEAEAAELEIQALIDRLHQEKLQQIAAEETNELAAIEKRKQAESEAAIQKQELRYKVSETIKKISEKEADDHKKAMQELGRWAETFVQSGIQGIATKGVSTLTEDFLPGFGGAAGQMFSLLSQDTDKFLETVNTLFSAKFVTNIAKNVPVMIEKFVEALPDLVQALVEFTPQIAIGLAKVFTRPEFYEALTIGLVKGFAAGWMEGTKNLWKHIVDALKKAWEDVKDMFEIKAPGSGGGGGGGAVPFKNKPTATNPLGFAKGGLVPNFPLQKFAAGGTVDTVPAMLAPGEFVVNAEATRRNFGALQSINNGSGGGSTINVTFTGPFLGDQQHAAAFAKIIDSELLKLRQQNRSVAFDSATF